MKTRTVLIGWLCLAAVAEAQDARQTLLEARKGHVTKLQREERDPQPLTPPPPELFTLETYKGSAGRLSAYLTAPPENGEKVPVMVWITGGFPPGGIGPEAWSEPDPANDQSAQAYWLEGVALMFPTLRGSFGNAGVQQGFYGEVDDVLAALAHLRTLAWIDQKAIYLGGHSTGGTLALLVAAATDEFRGIVSFGPVANPIDYGSDSLPYSADDEAEVRLRAPIGFLGAIRSPTVVIEGDGGNIDSLEELRAASKNSKLSFCAIEGCDHFEVLAPINELLAEKIAQAGPKDEFSLTQAAASGAVAEQRACRREAADLSVLAELRGAGFELGVEQEARFLLLSYDEDEIEAAAKAAASANFRALDLEEEIDEDGDTLYVLYVTRRLKLGDLEAMFQASAAAEKLARNPAVYYQGWDVEKA